MTLKFNITIQDTSVDYPLTIVRADVIDDHGNSVKSKAWIDKDYPKNDEALGNIIHDVVDDLFPKKSAPEITESKQTPIKRGKTK